VRYDYIIEKEVKILNSTLLRGKIEDFYNFVSNNFKNNFSSTFCEIPKESDLVFNINKLLFEFILLKNNYKIVTQLEARFFSSNKKYGKKTKKIDIGIFYLKPNNINNFYFLDIIEIKRAGKAPKKITDGYFLKSESNTIAKDFERLVEFLNEPIKLVRQKYKGEFKETYNIKSGLFIDLHPEDNKKEAIEKGVKYWRKKIETNGLNVKIHDPLISKIPNLVGEEEDYLSFVLFERIKK